MNRSQHGFMKRRIRGASLIEFVIVVPVFAMLVFGIFEMALMYRTKATLSAATFEAAQAGTMNNAQLKYMRDGLAQGMMPLYLRARSAGAVATAYAATRAKVQLGIAGAVSVVSPNRSVFTAFKQRQPVTISGDNSERMRDVIPNDNLMWRDSRPKSVRVDGRNVQMNVQDANLLKVKTFWCHRLLTPFLDWFIYKAATGVTLAEAAAYRQAVPEQVKCDLIPGDGLAGKAYYIALTNSTVTRMQSAVVQNDLP